jgi:hypothetical protein
LNITVYAEVDEALFLEVKANKRLVHFKSSKFPARTLVEELPEVSDVEEFNLQTHIENLSASSNSAAENEL